MGEAYLFMIQIKTNLVFLDEILTALNQFNSREVKIGGDLKLICEKNLDIRKANHSQMVKLKCLLIQLFKKKHTV